VARFQHYFATRDSLGLERVEVLFVLNYPSSITELYINESAGAFFRGQPLIGIVGTYPTNDIAYGMFIERFGFYAWRGGSTSEGYAAVGGVEAQRKRMRFSG